MQEMTLGTLSFICGPNPTQGFGVTLDPAIQGLDASEYRIVSYATPGQDGGVVSQAHHDTRLITFSGIVSGTSPSNYLATRKLLIEANAISRDSFGFPVLTQLSFMTLDGNSYFIMVQPQQPKIPFGNPTWSKYSASMLAPDYRIYGTTQRTTGQITRLVSGGIIVPCIVPVLGGGTSGGSGIITNSGDTDSPPILTFVGPLTNPYVVNQTTGYAFQLDLTIPGGSNVVVDMYRMQVIFNGSSSYIQYKDDISNWWTVVPGQNNIVLGTGSSADTGYVQVVAYDAWAGI